jgi:GH15 family glucan-1,4-alpha-glucosidase
MDDFRKSMQGIFSTSIHESTLDESPMVYKPMEEIISKIGDTVEVLTTLKPIYNYKAGN